MEVAEWKAGNPLTVGVAVPALCCTRSVLPQGVFLPERGPRSRAALHRGGIPQRAGSQKPNTPWEHRSWINPSASPGLGAKQGGEDAAEVSENLGGHLSHT